MISNMPRYEQMKDSGVEWLGEIPEHWKLLRLKMLLSEVNERSDEGSEELLSLSKTKGVIPKSSLEERAGQANSLVGYKKVSNGHLVINKMQAVNGLVAVSRLNGITSPDYSVYKVKNDKVLNIDYIGYILTQPEYLAEFKKRVKGVMEGFIRLYTDDLYDIKSILPPISEQAAIANFLDKKTAQIDQAIALKQKQIELFKERKQLVIQHAVTKGLNPNASMRDSGVEWIGEIPEHWEVKKMKFFATIKNGLDYKNVVSDSGYPVIGSGGQFAYANKYLYDGEAVLLGRKGTIDKPLYINGKFWTVDTMFYSICNTSVITKFVYYLATVIPFKRYSTATALPSMTQTDLLNHKHSIPPLEEQTAIVAHIETQSAKIDKAIDIQQQQINKLKEYKATLINSAVTGKIKVC